MFGIFRAAAAGPQRARRASPGLAKQHLGGKAFSNSAPGRVRACVRRLDMVMEKRNKAQRKRDTRLPVARERASFDIFTTFPTAL
jgi:hypothetical protein